MEIRDNSIINGKRILFCVGEDIKELAGAKRLYIENKSYDILGYDILRTLTGVAAALIEVEIDASVTLGEAHISYAQGKERK